MSHKRYYGQSLSTLGQVAVALKLPDAAVQHFREAYETFQALVKFDPSNARWEIDLGRACLDLSEGLSDPQAAITDEVKRLVEEGSAIVRKRSEMLGNEGQEMLRRFDSIVHPLSP